MSDLLERQVKAATAAILNAKKPDGKRVYWSPMYIPPYAAAEIFARAALEAAALVDDKREGK
jgi:hypothetical protein